MPIILKNKMVFKIGYCSHPPLKNGEKLSKEEAVDKLSKIKTIDTNRKISSKVINNIINFILFNDI